MNKLLDSLKGDRAIWLMVILLSGIGLIEVFSATSMLAYKFKDGQTTYYFLRHLGFIIGGFAIMFIVSRVSYKYYFKLAGFFLCTMIVLLAVTLLTAQETNDARRWLTIPLIGIKFQTSDPAKLALMIYLAKVISTAQQEGVKMFDVFKKCMAAVIVVCCLVLPANFSTAFLIGCASMTVLFIGKMNPKWLLASLGVAILLFGLFVGVMQFTGTHSRVGTWTKRIETFFDSNASSSADFQAQQSKIAIALGGVSGKGPGNSQQRNILPHPYSDFIYSIVVEEGGLITGTVVVILYLVFFYRCILIVKNSERAFPAFLALGLSLNIILQAVANMLVAVNITPVTGQPLPFISMGGTSILFTSFSVGVILNISRYAEKRETVEEIEEEMEVEEITDYPFIAG
jgi:cell division protein FtsW